MPHERQAPSPPDGRRRRTGVRRAVGRVAVVIGLVVTLAGATLALGGGPAQAIVAGRDTTISEVPWQVSLRTDGELICGGSIIGDQLVLTAAHCTEGLEPAELTVRAGVTEASDDNGQDRVVTKIFEHPGYAEDGIADVSVLVLAEPLLTGENVQPVDLADADELQLATTAVVSGWGVRSEDDEDEDLLEQLQSTTVALVDDSTCADLLDPDWHDPDQETCTGGTDPETRDGDAPGPGSCYGDSGGPLVVRDASGTPKLVGVVSWGIECGVSPDVYAEVPTFASWIRSITPDTTPEPRDIDTTDDAHDIDDADERFDDSSQGSVDGLDEWSDADFEKWFDDCWVALDEWVQTPGDGPLVLEDESCTEMLFDA